MKDFYALQLRVRVQTGKPLQKHRDCTTNNYCSGVREFLHCAGQRTNYLIPERCIDATQESDGGNTTVSTDVRS